MKEIVENHWAIDADTDVVRCTDSGRFFLRQYQHVTPHNIRDSVSFDTRDEAVESYRAGLAVWEEWG